MDELKAFLRGLDGEESRVDFAKRCETSLGHLRNIIYGDGRKTCSPELAALIDIESGGVVRRWHMRPLDWHRIWPELIGAEGAPRVAGVRAVAAKAPKLPKKTVHAVASESVVWPLSQQEADRIVYGAAQPPRPQGGERPSKPRSERR
jgi:hypothetical protein